MSQRQFIDAAGDAVRVLASGLLNRNSDSSTEQAQLDAYRDDIQAVLIGKTAAEVAVLVGTLGDLATQMLAHIARMDPDERPPEELLQQLALRLRAGLESQVSGPGEDA